MAWECRDWSAVHDHMPGPNEGPILRVRGTVQCPTTGYEVQLEPGNQGINPGHLRLKLSVTPPSEGEDVITDVLAELDEPTQTEYDKVEIYGDCEALIDVVEVDGNK